VDHATPMHAPSQVVSIHPYFKVKPGRLAEARAFLARFVALVEKEPANLYYDFTLRDDVVFCREAYVGAQGLLDHSAGVATALGEFLQIADLIRLEIHGSAAELEKLRPAFGPMNPEWFVFECGVSR
jgi:quinol monooxygenase YgiN